MTLHLLHIHNLRNLVEAKVELAPQFNLLHGLNGSGKTSFLEAIYYLGLGRSFRTRLNSRIINHQAEHFALFAQINQENQRIPVGLERHANGELRIRIAQENARSLLALTEILPLQLLNTDSRQLLIGGSKIRRQFIDWGVFHVEPSFMTHWQHAQRILKQRNAALKQHAARSTVQIWDEELDATAQILDRLRQNYLEQFIPAFNTILTAFLPTIEITLGYKSGWNESLGLKKVLEQSWSRDLQIGYTQTGPQRADLAIRINHIPAQDILSQGQQKLLVYALRLAQGLLLKTQKAKACVYLLDDLPAELDLPNQHKVAHVLRNMAAQVFITGVASEALKEFQDFPDSTMFHVKHGENPISAV